MDQYNQLKQLLFDSLEQFIQNAGAYLPNILGAVSLMVLGLLIAWSLKWLILRLGAGIDRMLQVIGFATVTHKIKWPLSVIIANILFWLVILLFLRAAIASLGLPSIAEMLGNVITSLPSILTAAIIIFGGILVGNVVRDKIIIGTSSAGLRQGSMLATWMRTGIIVLAVIAGLSQIGLDVRLFEYLLVIFTAAIFGAIALAFGMGAGPVVANILSSRYIKKNYSVGQKIRINEQEGTILELTQTGVMLDTDSGRTFIPAKVFDENASILLDNDSIDGN